MGKRYLLLFGYLLTIPLLLGLGVYLSEVNDNRTKSASMVLFTVDVSDQLDRLLSSLLAMEDQADACMFQPSASCKHEFAERRMAFQRQHDHLHDLVSGVDGYHSELDSIEAMMDQYDIVAELSMDSTKARTLHEMETLQQRRDILVTSIRQGIARIQYAEYGIMRQRMASNRQDVQETSTIFYGILTILVLVIVLTLVSVVLSVRAIQRSQRQLKESLREVTGFKYALDASSIVTNANPDGTIKYCNDAFVNTYGYTREEVLGQEHRIIKSGHHNKEFVKNVWDTIQAGRVWRGEFKNKTKSGALVWLDTTIVPFTDEYGKPYQYVSIQTDITARKEANEEIARSHELTETIFRSLGNVILFSIDTEYRLLSFNNEFDLSSQNMYGFKAYVGLNILTTIPEAQRGILQEQLDLTLAGHRRMRINSHGGGKFVLEEWHNPILGSSGDVIGATVIAVDVTERIRREAELRKTKALLESTVESLHEVGILSVDLQYCILSANRFFTDRLRNQNGEEIKVGDNVLEFLPHALKERVRANMDRSIRGESFVDVEIHYSPERRIFETHWSPLCDEGGEIIGVTVMSTDTTEREQAAEELRIINENLLTARKEAEQANSAKSQFLANMSHEIRTPLNAVIGLSHLALKTDLNPRQFDYLKKIQSSGESLLSIINDILDFSKIEAGKLTLEETAFDLEVVFQHLANVITYRASAKGLEVAFGLDHHVPTYLIGDPVRLEQILTNLCSNAVKFTASGEVAILVKQTAEQDGAVTLLFEVRDTGIGMEKEQMDRLFSPFTQADSSVSRKYGGTGLGLSIAKRLVDMMGGTIWVESKPGKGSSFFFRITLKRQSHQRSFPQPRIDLRGLSVMLVDDNQTSLGILQDALESFSFKVSAFRSGRDLITYLQYNIPPQPFLVLMDWKMPELDGIHCVERMRALKSLTDFRVVMMSDGYGNDELYDRVEQLGLAGVLIKPTRYSELYNTIIEAMGADAGAVSVKDAPPKVARVHRASVLLVEDNETNQQVAYELLSDLGMRVEIAVHGEEAVSKVKASGHPSRYDVVLMDLQMPVMDGLEATRAIREMEAYKSLPILAMTADAQTESRAQCLAAGMNGFIAKPIDPARLLEILETQLYADKSAPQSAVADEESKPGMPWAPVDGIDFQEGLSHLAGHIGLYKRMLRKFFAAHTTFMDDVRVKYLKGQDEEGNRSIHSLKGIAGSLGMKVLYELIRELEPRIKASKGSDRDALLNDIQRELDRVLASLKVRLQEEDAKGTPPS